VEEMAKVFLQDCCEGERGGFHSKRLGNNPKSRFIKDGENTKCLLWKA
jgi:hypothetical protein